PDAKAFDALVDAGLEYLAGTVLGFAPPAILTRGRLTVMAHSGGGAGLSKLLGHATNALDPDEVVCFDSLYGGESAIARWAVAKIGSSAASTAGLRAFYTGCSTASWSFRKKDQRWHLVSTEVSARRLQAAIEDAVALRPAADRAA